MKNKKQFDSNKLDKVVVEARKNRENREAGYRERALKLYPWVCGKCRREFTRENLRELTVHHVDHDHDNNPLDGSNWELLCLFCHDHEHSKYLEHSDFGGESGNKVDEATFSPFGDLKKMMSDKN
ncbi:MAG: HNH nuclease family protein [Methylococcales bacterium]|nr:HNH nuclease family protein [Methylococcales bacterium]MBT7411032.1 HNH nuclease family protein [Methylococcales bacterium]